MLFFLSIAAEQGYQVDHYSDEAVGTLSKDSEGKLSMTAVHLNPRIAFSGEKIPDDGRHCGNFTTAHIISVFIANSVKSKISINGI